MRKIALVISLFCVAAFADSENWNGWGDTARINTFRADSLKYSKAFPLSKFENLRATVYLDDTSSAVFATDSVKAIWGFQVGHPAYFNTSSIFSRQTMIWGEEVTADTFDMLTAANFVKTRPVIGSDGTYSNSLKFIDSLTATGKAYQTRSISPDFDVYVRFWIKGLTGNKKGSFVSTVFELTQRAYLPTRNR